MTFVWFDYILLKLEMQASGCGKLFDIIDGLIKSCGKLFHDDTGFADEVAEFGEEIVGDFHAERHFEWSFGVAFFQNEDYILDAKVDVGEAADSREEIGVVGMFD